MNTNILKKKLIIIFLTIAMLVPYIPVFTPVVEAERVGYHYVIHNNGNWTKWGGSLDGCNNYVAESKTCYHYRNWHTIGDKEVIYSGEQLDGGGSMKIYRDDIVEDGINYTKDVRVFKWMITESDCQEFPKNGKYIQAYGYRYVNKEQEPERELNGKYLWDPNNLITDLEKNLFIDNKTTYGLRRNDGCELTGHPDDWHLCNEGIYYCENSHTISRYKCQGHEDPNTYTVTYNANGGTGSTANTYHTYDVDGSLALNGFSNTGYTFGGWTDGTHTYSAGQTVKNLTATNGGVVNLTAVWIRNNYNLNVNPNGGTWEGSTSEQNFTIAYEGTKTISNPIRYGYSFNGWSLSGTGSTLTETTFRMGYQNASLTAGWTLITHNITGTVTWNDQNNKYNARRNVSVTLSRTPTTGSVTPVPSPVQVAGNATYTFNNVQTYDTTTNNAYTYSVSQNKVPGYRTTINNFTITNDLILPTYTSNITYTPIDTYQNKYLKNGKVKIEANVQATSPNTYQELGLNNGIVTFNIDNNIILDTNTLKIYHTNSSGVRTQITNYTLNGNTLTVDFGENKISKTKDKLEIEIYGTLNQIKEYTSSINLTGKLRAYNVENTNIKLVTITSKTAKITSQYQMHKENIKITNHDSITEQNLTDATFTLYEWNGSTYVEKETIKDTNKDGIYESNYYEWNKTTEGKYKIVETGIPEKHKDLGFSMEFTINQLVQGNYTITPDYNNSAYKITYGIRNPDDLDSINGTVENEPYKIKASIDLLDSENLRQIQGEATFKIYEWDKANNQYKIYTSYTTGNEVKVKRLENKTYITEEWLYYTPNNEGKYRIIEETAPYGYYGDYEDDNASIKRTYDITVLEIVGQNGTTISLSNQNGKFVNQRTKAKINLSKIDTETKGAAQGDATLGGAVYELYAKENIYHADGITQNYEDEPALLYKKDQIIQTVATNEEGKLVFENLECGKYYIKEKTPSNGYLLDQNTYELDLTYQNETNKLIEKDQTSEEKVKKQGFQIYKIKQTDRTEYEGLQNAGFTIYRINNLSIVKEGKISKNQDGTYTLNDPIAKEDQTLKKQANKNGTYKIQDLIDYYYKIKYTENNMESLPQDETSYHPYNINEEKVKNYASSQEGTYIEELKTNGDGYLRSPELAYGEYIVLETTVPKNLETAKPFYINIQNDSRNVQKLKFIQDDNFETKIKIYKEDSTTGKTVLKAGTKYVIRNSAGDLMTINSWDATHGYVEYGTETNPFETGTDGYLVTPMSLPVGKYTLEEIEAPNGYVLEGHEGTSVNGQTVKNPRTKVEFEISTNQIYYTDDFLDTNIIVIKQQNQPQLGSLKITTEGEYVSGANKNADGNYTFTYETKPVEGATYQIKAKENILTQDGHNTVIYQKDQVISTVTTNNEGIAYVDNLPQGKYYIEQTIAGNGFTLNKEQKEFEITYGTNEQNLQIGTKEWKEKAETTPVIHKEETYTNQRQKLQIEIEKIDPETNQKLHGAEIGLYVANDIKNQETNQTILEKDTLVEKQTTNQEGKITYSENLPLGNYYVKEIKAPEKYVYNGETKAIDGTYDTSQTETKQIKTTIENEKTSINIQKTTKDDKNLAGATLELRDSKGQIVESWTTEEKAKNIKALKTNEQYKIIETEPAKGYVTAKEITFSITDNGTIQTEAQIKEQNTIIMKDQTTKIIVELQDPKTKEQVSGAILKIVNEQGEIVAEFETKEIAEEIEKLPIGKYTIIEEKEPEGKGYVTIPEVKFEIKDTEESQRIVLTQEQTKIQISLKDIETKEAVVRATLQLIKKNEEREEEQILEEWISMVEPHQIEQLPVGKYWVREIVTPTDRGYATIKDHEIEVKNTIQTQVVEILNDITKVTVNLVDKDTKENIIGAILQLNNKETGETIREWETTEESYKTTRIPVGNYIIKNKKANIELGQVTIEEKETQIKDTEEEQIITLEQDYTKLEIELIDRETKQLIEGIKFEIYKIEEKEKQDDQGNTKKEKQKGEKVREFTTGADNYFTERLGVGEYILHEVEGQIEAIQDKGYATLEDTYFKIEDTSEAKKISLEQDYTKLEIEIQDKKSKEKLQGIKLEIYKVEETENGEKQKGEKVREFITGEENYYTERLPVGEYVIHEVEGQKEVQNKGYVTLEDTYFKIEDKIEIQKILLEQEYTKVEIKIIDTETKKSIEGIKIEIYKVEEDENGEKKPGEKIGEIETGKEGNELEKLPVGEYIIRELEEQKELQDKGYVTMEDIYFKIEDKPGVQKVEIEQSKSKLEIELVDKETKEKIEKSTLQIIKIAEDGKEEQIKEIKTTKENSIVEKLAIGEYILRQTEEGIQEQGYVRIQDKKFKIIDTVKTQKMIIKQDYTKIEISVIDKETKELVLGAKISLQDKNGNDIVEDWLSTKEAKKIERIPVGEYYIVEKEAPTLRGYVKTDKVEIKIEETSETQKYELEQDYTKVQIELVDQETKEEIEEEIELVIKDEKGNIVAEIKKDSNTEEIDQILEKLPVGEYILESTKEPYGYKPIKKQIEIKDTQEVQKIGPIEIEREIFDIEVQEWIDKIERNGKEEYKNQKEEQTVKKLDVKDKKIPTEDIKITYKIRVKNIGKIRGEVGKIEVTIPAGMEFKKENNKGYWEEEGGKIITTGLAGRELKEGAKAELEITFRWKNGLENFGSKRSKVEIKEVTSDIGFKEANEENNIAETKDVIIGVSTGEMNILWACWGLLITLILIEIYVTKKLHIKKFKLKDRTLKYRNKK